MYVSLTTCLIRLNVKVKVKVPQDCTHCIMLETVLTVTSWTPQTLGGADCTVCDDWQWAWLQYSTSGRGHVDVVGL